MKKLLGWILIEILFSVLVMAVAAIFDLDPVVIKCGGAALFIGSISVASLAVKSEFFDGNSLAIARAAAKALGLEE